MTTIEEVYIACLRNAAEVVGAALLGNAPDGAEEGYIENIREAHLAMDVEERYQAILEEVAYVVAEEEGCELEDVRQAVLGLMQAPPPALLEALEKVQVVCEAEIP